MINPFFQRLSLLTGAEAAAAFERSRVIVAGLGGVGSWCAEALVRSGIGRISLIDSDTVCPSNVNRQVEALSTTIGRPKTEVMEERLKDINPSCEVTSFPLLFSGETAALFDLPGADYIIDAIDTMPHKIDLIEAALVSGARLFSSMGMAMKLDPTLIKTADIWETSGCPLARLVRGELRKRKTFAHFTAVYSPERLPPREDIPPPGIAPGAPGAERESAGKKVNGSAVTVTAAAGMILASLVIRDISARFPPQPLDGAREAAL